MQRLRQTSEDAAQAHAVSDIFFVSCNFFPAATVKGCSAPRHTLRQAKKRKGKKTKRAGEQPPSPPRLLTVRVRVARHAN
jgi:hypothetical protein